MHLAGTAATISTTPRRHHDSNRNAHERKRDQARECPGIGQLRMSAAARARRAIVSRVTFSLEALSVAVAARVETWARLEMRWHARSIQPNYGKPVVSVDFESSAWLARSRSGSAARRTWTRSAD
jgi:hypothetical protein